MLRCVGSYLVALHRRLWKVIFRAIFGKLRSRDRQCRTMGLQLVLLGFGPCRPSGGYFHNSCYLEASCVGFFLPLSFATVALMAEHGLHFDSVKWIFEST